MIQIKVLFHPSINNLFIFLLQIKDYTEKNKEEQLLTSVIQVNTLLTLQYTFSSKAAVHTAIEKLWLNLNRDPSHRISRLFEIWVHWAHPLPSFLRWINKKFHTKQFFCSLEDIICFLFWIQHVYLACHNSKYFFNAQFFFCH